MSKKITITPKQMKAIEDIINYSMDDERNHLDEDFGTEHDIDTTEMDDDEVAKLCRKHDKTDHAWYKLYILSTIK